MHGCRMAERPSKTRDVNSMAAAIVAMPVRAEPVPEPGAGRNQHAFALGREGGLKGGEARAASLTPEHRSEIARRAAIARWSREP